MSKPTPLQVAHSESGDMAPSGQTRERLTVALAYCRKQITVKGAAKAFDCKIPQVYPSAFRLIKTAIREGWLVEMD